jgi:pimeloyl-ACP methyl ester carboxylesterase
VLTGSFAEYFAGATRAGLEHGVHGWFDDDIACLQDWGFELADVSRPVTIWQGAQDRMVPFGHGEWLAAHTSGARAQLLPDEGHLSLVIAHYGRLLDDLLTSG